MNRRVRIIVECEDSLHRAFASRFLRGVGIPEGRSPEIRPRGPEGAVLEHVVEGVLDARDTTATAHLIVLVDGDNWTEEKTLTLVNRRLTLSRHPPLSNADRVLLLVAGRRMDTWVRHLRGEDVDERDRPGRKLGDNSVAREPAKVLAEHCREWQAYRARHGL